jgi:NAD-dependent SIR2 family protein deacetylase
MDRTQELLERKKELERYFGFSDKTPNKDVSLHGELKTIKNTLADNHNKEVREAMAKAHKLCPACGKEKPLSAFYADRKSYTGYSSHCKACSAKKK